MNPFYPALAAITHLLLAAAAAAEPANPPSKVDHAVKESELPLLKITPQAEQRLGVKTVRVEQRNMPEARAFPGTVILPLSPPDGGGRPGTLPVGAPDDFRRIAEQQVIADGAVAAAKASLTGATQSLARAEKLAGEKAGSERALDDARTLAAVANAALDTAVSQRALLGTNVATVLKSPRRWVSVSVSPADLARLDPAQPAAVSPPGDPKATPVQARPAAAPPAASALTGTVDLFYELDDASLLAGQRVQIGLLLRNSETQRLILPWSAVLFDPQGGAWVYEQTAPQTYTRRRVSILRVAGKVAVLEAGPAAGALIVSEAAAELFGAEFGGFK